MTAAASVAGLPNAELTGLVRTMATFALPLELPELDALELEPVLELELEPQPAATTATTAALSAVSPNRRTYPLLIRCSIRRRCPFRRCPFGDRKHYPPKLDASAGTSVEGRLRVANGADSAF